jgi:phosphoribosylamine--glycine ligase
MNVMVIGGGGREHALAWKIAQSVHVERVFAVPGNPGTLTETKVENVTLNGNDAIVAFAVQHGVDLVVVGPEQPLVDGVADALRSADVLVVGPGADGAWLEGSKAFCKEVAVSAGVPTAEYAQVTSFEQIDRFVDSFTGAALVVKADGLAAGKGVVVCDDKEQARDAAKKMLAERTFGDASSTIVLEERLEGTEVSYMILTDGTRFQALPTSQDHKRLLDGDLGPNTGGMGAFSPATFLSERDIEEIEARIIEPTLVELRRRNIDYRGFLYAGVMLTNAGPMLLEFNVRLGDPETQVLMMALDEDIVPSLTAAASGELESRNLRTKGAAAVVVLAAEGYPESPVKGAVITSTLPEGSTARLFHAGTAWVDGKLVVAGGRVIGVASAAATPQEALHGVYSATAQVKWAGMQFRRDIGKVLA